MGNVGSFAELSFSEGKTWNGTRPGPFLQALSWTNDGLNLFPDWENQAWLSGTFGIQDPDLNNRDKEAWSFTDSSTTVSEKTEMETIAFSSTDLVVSFWFKKEEQSTFPAFQILTATTTTTVAINLSTGILSASGEIPDEMASIEFNDWWFIGLHLASVATDFLQLRIYPSYGKVSSFPSSDVSAKGELTFYGVRAVDGVANPNAKAVPLPENFE